MSGFKMIILLLFFLMVQPLFGNTPAETNRRSVSSPFFVASSLGHWTERGNISNSIDNFKLNISNLGLGIGLGYAFSFPNISCMVQGQMIFEQSNIGFAPGKSQPGVELEGQNLSSLGFRTDFSFLRRLSEGVGVGLGFPVMKMFFLTGKLASGYEIKREHSLGWGIYANMRLRKNAFVFSPKVGFLNELSHYFAVMDFQFHFH